MLCSLLIASAPATYSRIAPVCCVQPHKIQPERSHHAALLKRCALLLSWLCSAAAYVAVDDFFAKLMEIVQRLKEAGVQNVVLITPPPVNEAASGAVLPGQVSCAAQTQIRANVRQQSCRQLMHKLGQHQSLQQRLLPAAAAQHCSTTLCHMQLPYQSL